jgi:hypothetical protein
MRDQAKPTNEPIRSTEVAQKSRLYETLAIAEAAHWEASTEDLNSAPRRGR